MSPHIHFIRWITGKCLQSITIVAALVNLHSVQAQTMVKYESFENDMSQGGWALNAGSPQSFINTANNGVFQMGFPAAGYNMLSPAQRLNGNLQTDTYYYSQSATAPYNPTLTGNPTGLVAWYFNIRSGVAGTQPGGICGTTSGCGTNRLGMGVVLASGTQPNAHTGDFGGGTCDRYAVVYGDAGDASATNGKLQLVAIPSGSNYSARTVITGTAGTLSSFFGGGALPDDYYSVKVTYLPSSNTWSLYARRDGASGWQDPLHPNPYTLIGTGVNSSFTGSVLNFMGFVGQMRNSTDRAFFDNYYVFTGIRSSPPTPEISVTSWSQTLTGAAANTAEMSYCSTTNLNQFYEVFGTNLTANLVITPPAGIEISTSPTTGFTTGTITLTPTAGEVQAKLWVRPSSGVTGSGNITHASTGATTRNLAVTEVPLGGPAVSDVTVVCDSPSIPLSLTYAAAGTTIVGRWDAYNDPRAYTVTSGMANNTTTCGFQSGTTGIRGYSAQEFRVSVTGSYTFTMRTQPGYDGAGYIVSGPFVPGICPGAGTWIVGADNAAGEPILGPVNLTAGVSYTLISTTGGTSTIQPCYTTDLSYVWDITAPPGGQVQLPVMTCDNHIAGHWRAYHTATPATQVQFYGRGVTTGMSNAATCSMTTSNNRNVATHDFTVSTTGVYTFTMANNISFDGYGYITSGNWSTGGTCSATGTWIVGDDNSGVNEPILSANLTAGVLYTLHSGTMGANNTSFSGAFNWSVTGPGNILVTGNGGGSGVLQWYTAPTGGSPIWTGGSFDPVGVDPLLTSTSTPGTWTYYVAFSNSPNCRVPVNYIIDCLLDAQTLFLNASHEGNDIRLNLKSQADPEGALYRVERREEGSAWVTVGSFRPDMGWTGELVFLDQEPPMGWLHYRVTRHDEDGHQTASNITSILHQSVNGSVNIFPNPTHSHLRIVASDEWLGAKIKLLNLHGIQLIEETLPLHNASAELHLLDFPEGLYILLLEKDGSSYSQLVRLER